MAVADQTGRGLGQPGRQPLPPCSARKSKRVTGSSCRGAVRGSRAETCLPHDPPRRRSDVRRRQRPSRRKTREVVRVQARYLPAARRTSSVPGSFGTAVTRISRSRRPRGGDHEPAHGHRRRPERLPRWREYERVGESAPWNARQKGRAGHGNPSARRPPDRARAQPMRPPTPGCHRPLLVGGARTGAEGLSDVYAGATYASAALPTRAMKQSVVTATAVAAAAQRSRPRLTEADHQARRSHERGTPNAGVMTGRRPKMATQRASARRLTQPERCGDREYYDRHGTHGHRIRRRTSTTGDPRRAGKHPEIRGCRRQHSAGWRAPSTPAK